MSREATLILLGIVLAIGCFFSGLPFSLLRWVFAALGVAIALIGYTLQARRAETLAAETAPAQ
jgi:hypothetical protein